MLIGDTRRVAWEPSGVIGSLSRSGRVIAAATVLGLGLRLYLITRHGFLTSGTVEYDDGVYLGATIRLTQGALPYRDFAFVQPPGILLLSLPAALVGRAVSATAGMMVARLLTVLASVACIPLAGRLVQHRGALVTLVTCGFLAIYPADILASRTLLLEPWMNLCCLLGANLAFSNGKLNGKRALAWAGVAFGFAVAVKYWAVVPAALLGVLASPLGTWAGGDGNWRLVRAYGAGLVLGFAVPVIPFLVASPAGFIRGTVFDQVARTGTAVPTGMRLAYLTGVIDLMNRHGMVTLAAVSHSVFARASTGTTSTADAGLLPVALAAITVIAVTIAYASRPRRRSTLEWFALATAVLSALAILSYSAFFYHYPDFTGPWLAIALGGMVGVVSWAGTARWLAAGAVAVALLAVATLQTREIQKIDPPANPSVAALIPAGACVVTDQVSLTIAADRFTAARPGCPDVVDSLATTLSLGDGTSPQGGAGQLPQVISAWRSVLSRADYVWLTTGYDDRIPWPDSLQTWFASNFQLVRDFKKDGNSELYKRR
jgi:hypothetical protein